MKKLLSVLALVFAFMMFAVACAAPAQNEEPAAQPAAEQAPHAPAAGADSGADSAPAPAPETKTGSLTIGISINGVGNIHNRHMFEGLKEVCEGRGHKVVAVNANGDATQQVTDVENLIQAGCDVIVIQCADSFSMKNVVADAASNLNKRGVLKDVSFNVRSGEIVGMFGLVGAGRTEAIRATLGVDQYDSAKITLEGKPVKFRNIGQAFNAGVVLVPEERRRQGILPNTPIYKNVTMGCLKSFEHFGLINRKKELAYAKKSTDMLSVACSSLKQTVGSLSGGNQQKVVISKYIDRDVKVFILDEPTRGIDVGAKDQIYHIIEGLAKKGMAVIVISSEIPELQRLCDRICIMSEGRVTGEISRKDFADSDKILRNAIGV